MVTAKTAKSFAELHCEITHDNHQQNETDDGCDPGLICSLKI